MLGAGGVPGNEDGRDGVPGPFPEASVGRTDVAVVLMQSRGCAAFERRADHVPGKGISDTLTIGLGASAPFLRRTTPLGNAADGSCPGNRARSECAREIQLPAFAGCERRELRSYRGGGRAAHAAFGIGGWIVGRRPRQYCSSVLVRRFATTATQLQPRNFA